MLILLDTGIHEVAFFTKYENYTLCTVGRRENSKEEALLGYNLRFFTFGNSSYSYTVETVKRKCLAGVVTKGNINLVLYTGNGIQNVYEFSSNGELMLWQLLKTEKGYFLVGGVKRNNWDAFVAFLDRNFKVKWKKRLDFLEEYFYSVAEKGNKVYAVGRIKRGKNWDALVCIFSDNGKLLESYSIGSEGKDYFRFVKNLGGEVIAVGRSEDKFGDSDFLIYDFKNYYLYDSGEYDYARAVNSYGNSYVIAGETRFKGNNDGIFILLSKNFRPVRAFKIGWENTDAVRFMDNLFFTGYTYSLSFSADLILGVFSEDFEKVDVKKVNRVLKKEKVHLRDFLSSSCV
ncbi:hypothetical protein [Aquifex aeolicus]|uniref:Uncharacterized protein aq_1022 n=1 Tax=Aquifex aeolicus (strain VF5) TaxID=224324 RepID=Y1022_AQUAE|nr:hypothetical protein [Aquifex aeolicus]O67134.1 RecName: Full=Uncharacterized protein aq_1022 [Aquifex aeolicus VF5]AAC07101.1 putative protein [Aquifex aeolicus VF5]